MLFVFESILYSEIKMPLMISNEGNAAMHLCLMAARVVAVESQRFYKDAFPLSSHLHRKICVRVHDLSVNTCNTLKMSMLSSTQW